MKRMAALIKENRMTTKQYYDLIRVCVRISHDMNDQAQADRFLKIIQDDDESLVEAHIDCNKLKAAYLVAIQSKSTGLPLVKRVREAAIERKNKAIVDICDKYLASALSAQS